MMAHRWLALFVHQQNVGGLPGIWYLLGLRPEALGLGGGMSLHTYCQPPCVETRSWQGDRVGSALSGSFSLFGCWPQRTGFATGLSCRLRSVFPVSSSGLGASIRPGHFSGCLTQKWRELFQQLGSCGVCTSMRVWVGEGVCRMFQVECVHVCMQEHKGVFIRPWLWMILVWLGSGAHLYRSVSVCMWFAHRCPLQIATVEDSWGHLL